MSNVSCATCENLRHFECPSPHYWCYENENCPCNADEIPDFEYSCEHYIEDPESIFFDY